MKNSYRLNRSTIYLLPLIDLPYEKYKARFVNAYITDKSAHIETPYHMVIQLTAGNNNNIIVDNSVITVYRKHIGSQLYDIVVVAIPEKFHVSFDKACMGLYSEMSKDAQQRVVQFPLNLNNKLLRLIFSKSEVLQLALYEHLKTPDVGDTPHNEELKQALSEVELDEKINESDYIAEEEPEILS